MSTLPQDFTFAEAFKDWLAYQTTDEFRAEVEMQQAIEAQFNRDHYQKHSEKFKRGSAKYRLNHHDLVVMREVAEQYKPMLYIQQSGLCAYCNRALGTNYEIDHRKPLIKGGTNALSNLCVCHTHCNRMKGAKTLK